MEAILCMSVTQVLTVIEIYQNLLQIWIYYKLHGIRASIGKTPMDAFHFIFLWIYVEIFMCRAINFEIILPTTLPEGVLIPIYQSNILKNRVSIGQIVKLNCLLDNS